MMPIRLDASYLFAIAALIVVLCGCNTTQFLDKSKGEQYLHKNVIKIEEKSGKIKNKSSLVSELTNLLVKRENKEMFRIPRQYFYYMAQDTFDRTKIGIAFNRWLAKRGEAPVFIDTISAYESVRSMESYLKSRGYFYANVSYKIKSNSDSTKATVTYTVQPDSRYIIDKFEFQSKDTALLRLLNNTIGKSILKPGAPVDVKLYDQEVVRITRFLRDNGYAYFNPQYVSNLEGFDSSNVKKTVSIRLKVLTPNNQNAHRKYTIGNIYVFPDYDPNLADIKPDTLIDGLFFGTGGQPFRVNLRTLASSIYIRPGEVYNQEALDNSIRQLGALGVFKPPTLKTEEDSLHLGTLNFKIYLSGNKKWEIGWDISASFTERSSNLAGRRLLIGLNINPSLRNRNVLKGAELLVSNLNFVPEANFFDKNQKFLNSLDFNFQNDLYFPRFTDYLGIWRRLRKWGITGPNFNKNLRQKATSRMSAGYNYLNLLDNYKLHFVNLSFGYDVPVSINHRVSINHFGVDIVLPSIIDSSIFDLVLDRNPALRASFSPQFITGLLFRDINFVYTSPPKTTGKSWYFRGYFDISGIELMAANLVYNTIAKTNKVFKVGNDVEFSHYAKLELDGRRYWQLTTNRSFIARLNLGAVLPYYSSKTVPYVKQFYVGGPYSIRGWYTRELGPGLYKGDSDNTLSRNLFYQAAALKMEFNLEYRFLMSRPFGMFNMYGAVFLDGGNIWTTENDPSRKGSQFSLQKEVDEDGLIVKDLFLRETALAVGYGFRVDVSYVVVRLDLGTPIRNNYPDPSRNNSYFVDPKTWQINKAGDVWKRFKNNTSFQLAIGYPF